MFKLSFSHNAHEPVNIESGRLTIGRDPQNDVVLDVDGVSGFHAEIVEDQGRFWLLDLGSTNGTRLDGQQVLGKVEIQAWQTIAIDEVEVSIEDPANRRPTVVRRAVNDVQPEDNSGAILTMSSGPYAGEVCFPVPYCVHPPNHIH